MQLDTLKPSTVEILSDLASLELYTQHLYRSFGNWGEVNGYLGLKKYFLNDIPTEESHYQKIAEYIAGWNVLPVLKPIPAPAIKYKSLMEVLQTYYDEMKIIFDKYVEAYEKLEEQEDCATAIFLQKYIKIQTQAMAEASTLINQLKNYGEGLGAMLFDKDILGA